MILIDTSVWIDHLRASIPELVTLLEEDQAACHPWVRGELALGSLKNRLDFLELLSLLPEIEMVTDRSVMAFIERNKLDQRDIGWVDVQLLAACIAWPCCIWTRDKCLKEISIELGINWEKQDY